MRASAVSARVLNDVGLAFWLAAAAAPDGGAGTDDGRARWPAWTWAAVAAHLVGAAMVTFDNRGRLLAQRGVLPVAGAKAVLTLVALGATASRSRAATTASTAAITGLNAVLGEQQRPASVAGGVLRRLVRA